MALWGRRTGCVSLLLVSSLLLLQSTNAVKQDPNTKTGEAHHTGGLIPGGTAGGTAGVGSNTRESVPSSVQKGCDCYTSLSFDQETYLTSGGYELQCNPRCLPEAPRSLSESTLCDPFNTGGYMCLMCQVEGCDIERAARGECVACENADPELLLERLRMTQGRSYHSKRRILHKHKVNSDNGGTVGAPAAPISEPEPKEAVPVDKGSAVGVGGGSVDGGGGGGGGGGTMGNIISGDSSLDARKSFDKKNSLPSYNRDQTYGLGDQYGSFPAKKPAPGCGGGGDGDSGAAKAACDEAVVACGPGTSDEDCDGYLSCSSVASYQICDCDDTNGDIGYILTDVYCEWFTSLRSSVRSTLYSRVCLEGENRNAWCQSCFDDVISTYPALSKSAINCDILGVN